jgi:M6 family metalloprotease-like protein
MLGYVNRTRTGSLIAAILITCNIFAYLQSANAVERKKASWLASCPEVVDATPQLATPKTVFLRSPSGQPLKLLAKDSVEFVTEPQSIIGCYVFEEYVINVNTSPAWQIGALNRDLNGYYFRNQAGITWRLTLNTETLILENEPGSLYYSQGSGFGLDRNLSKATDCKVKDFFLGYTRLGFPRNSSRLPQFGTTKNLILVVDFPDAALSENLNTIVDDVIAPRVVENFFIHSSNGKFNPTFDVFPRIIRLNSLEKSFAPNSTGGFFVNGVQQDHRLVQEAVGLAITQGNLDNYVSINVFAPTAKSMGYYGSAFMGLPLKTGSKTIINSQLVGGTIGTVRSGVPSWKVFAHEYGHLLGMHDYYIQGTGSSGKSPGPFDIMGNTSGNANSFFGFQRWVQGWLEDPEVICDFTINSTVTHTLNPLNQKLGKKLYVHPIDGSTVMVVEFRTETEVDSLKGNDGLLVYLIDMTVGSLKGPISIQPSEQDLVLNPRDDVERYSTAPLSTGQSVKVKDLVIVADTVGKDQASFRVFTKAEFLIKQEADAKATAELKAKQEADAKSAAELKAKQEAEAKAAAELKAKQEAAAKAAAIKKTTITCVKGKLTKKVTAVKPKCPAGYKKR